MDLQDHHKHSISSGHESNGVHLCRRCGWPFPNPHPSARHRRSHKKICGTIDGYTKLNHSEVVSDDEDSPKIEKKTSIGGGGGGGAIGGSFSRSEDDTFSDAVTEFSDTTSTGSANKTLDRDLFFSFKDAENEITKVDSSEAKSELPASDRKPLDDLVKDGVVEPKAEQSDVSQSQEAEFIDDVGAGVKLETETADGITEAIKHENTESESKHVSEAVKEAESGHEHGSEVAKESEIDRKVEEVGEETKHEKFELDHEHDSEVVKEPESVPSVMVLTEKDDLGEHESEKCSNKHTSEVVEEPDTVLIEKDDHGAPELKKGSYEHTHKVVEEPDMIPVEKEDIGAPKLEKDSNEQFQEDVNEPIAVLTENTDLGAPESEKHSNEQTHEGFEEPKSVFTEKEDLGSQNVEKTSKEDTMEVVQEPNLTLIEKEDLGAPKSENRSMEQIQEVANEPVTVLTEKDALDVPESEECSNKQTHEVLEEPKTVLTEKEDLVAPILEKNSKEHTFEVIEEPNSNLIEKKEDLGAPKHSDEHTHEVLEEPDTVLTQKENLGAQNLEKLPKEDTQEVTKEPKVDNCVVSEPTIGKVMTNQDSGVDLSIDSSSQTSLEGNWGSVSVLSTASIDDKSKFNSGKLDNNNHSGTSDMFEPPSFMTLVEPEVKDQKPGSSEVKDAQKAGWFPTISNVSNESEGRKKNEEVIAKVTNWSTGKHSAPLKSLLGEAKSPNVKEAEAEVLLGHKDEGEKQELLSSPPKLIEDGKKEGKKVKGRSSWMPFVCCSSINVVK